MESTQNIRMTPVVEAILSRRSCRSFKSDSVPDELIETVLAAGRHAPSGMNRQDWNFTVILNEFVMERIVDNIKSALADSDNPRLREAAKTDRFSPFYHAPVCILVSADEHGMTAIENASLAIGSMMLAAESLGLGACWIHAAKDLRETALGLETIRELRIPSGYLPVGSLVLGWREGPVPEAPARKEGTVNWIR